MSSLKPEIIPHLRSFTGKKIEFINRTEEMEILKNAADNAILGKGSVIILHGEAGIGKTRLTSELLSYAHSQKMKILHSSCPILFEEKGRTPYILWKNVIRAYLEDCSSNQLRKIIGDYPAEICKLVPETKKKLGKITKSIPISPDIEKDRLDEAVSQFITNISTVRPVVIVLDDLQWADRSSRRLLHYLARGIYRFPILLVGAYRDRDEVKPDLISVLTELNRERVSQSIKLKRLNLNETSQHVKQIFGQSNIPEEFCELVYQKTNGNPFFVEEILNSLKENGVIYREENEYKLKTIPEITFPRTVKSIFKSKLDRLDEESLKLLEIASCIGNDFSLDLLTEVSGYEKNRLLEILDEMLNSGLLKSKLVHIEVKCFFSDVIVRSILYEEISPFKLKHLHLIIAQALEKVYAKKIDDFYGELALHFLKGGDKEKALHYFLKAGEKAVSIYANNEAEFYFKSALELLEEKKDVMLEKAEVFESLGTISEHSGEYTSSVKYCNEALAIWKDLNKEERLAVLHLKIAHTYWSKMGNLQKAKEHQNKGIKLVETKQANEMANLKSDMAQMYFRVGDLRRARSLVNEALEIANKTNAYDIIANSNLTLGALYKLEGDHQNAILCFEKALNVSLNNNFMETAIYAYDNLGWAFKETEEKENRLECYKKGYDLAKKIGHISSLSWIGTNLSEMYIDMGETSRALHLVEESVALDRKTGNKINLTLSLAALGYTWAILGEWNTCEKYLNEALAISSELNDFPAIGLSYKALGRYYINRGEFKKGQEFAEKAYELSKKAGSVMHQAIAGYYSALCSIELGECERAERRIEELDKFSQQLDDKEREAYINGLKAVLLRSKQKYDESIKLFKKCKEQLETLKADVWDVYEFTKRIIVEYAQVCLARKQKGDLERAQILFDQALRTFKKMNAKNDVAIVESKIFGLEVAQEFDESEQESNIEIGFSILDKMLNGGIPPTFSVALSSPPNDQKNLLIRRYLESGLNQGQITFHITAELPSTENLTEEDVSKYYLFLCNPRSTSAPDNLPNFYKLGSKNDLTNLSIALSKAYRTTEQSSDTSKRACIEIVSDVLLQSNLKLTRQWLEHLLYNLKAKGFTTLATLNPLMHPPDQLHAILSLFDGEISIREKETERGTDRSLKIIRMNGQKFIKKEVHLTKNM